MIKFISIAFTSLIVCGFTSSLGQEDTTPVATRASEGTMKRAHRQLAVATKVAVVGPASTRDVCDLLTVELSAETSVVLLERSELAKVVTEKEMIACLRGEQYSKIGQLVSADGLVILSKEKTKEGTRQYARLVCAKTGIVLSYLSLPKDAKDVGIRAKLIKSKFLPLLSKIGYVDADAAVPVSLLGVHFELDSPTARELEGRLNTLLAHRLVHEDKVLVLERWAMSDLSLEKMIGGENSGTFWNGSYLVDGRVKEKDGGLQVSLRLRGSGDTSGEWIERNGKGDDLVKLVDELVMAVVKKIGLDANPVSWNSASEAARYALVAQYALANNLYKESMSALEAAMALGYEGEAARWLFIKACCLRAYTYSIDVGNSQYLKRCVDCENIDECVAAVIRAQEVLAEILSVPKGGFPADGAGLEMPALDRSQMMFTAVRILRAAYDEGYHKEAPEQLALLRRLFRQNIETLTRKRYAMNKSRWFHEHAVFWTDTPEEAIDFFRSRPDRVNYAQPLISWDPKDQHRLVPLWERFTKELLGSDHLAETAPGLMLQNRASKSIEDKEAVIEKRVLRRVPDLRKATVAPRRENEMVVSRFISAYHGREFGKEMLQNNDLAVVYFEGEIWLTDDDRNLIYRFNPVTEEASAMPCPKGNRTRGLTYLPYTSSLQVTSDYIYLVKYNLAWKYDRKKQTWKQFDIPMASYKGRLIDGWLYLVYNVYTGAGPSTAAVDGSRMSGNGVLRINLEDDTVEIVISSRRTPPISSLDGQDFGCPSMICRGLNGRLTIVIRKAFFDCVYEQNADDGKWQKTQVGKKSFYEHRLTEDGILAFPTTGIIDQVDYYPRDSAEPVALLNAAREKGSTDISGNPLWEYPTSLNLQYHEGTMHKGDLYLLDQDARLKGKGVGTGGQAWFVGSGHCLYVFKKGKPESVKIPLHFAVPSKLKEDVTGKHAIMDEPVVSRIVPTDDGLVIIAKHATGIWFITYKEIEDYCETHAQLSNKAAVD